MRRPLRAAPTAGVVLLLLLLPLVGCGEDRPASGAEAGPAVGGRLVVGVPSDVDAWNEYLTRQAATRTVLRRIWPPLADPAADGTGFTPRLAESWSLSDDGTLLTVTLRDHTWSDGVLLTADDVVFTWEAQTSDDVPWVGRTAKDRIVAVEATTDRTVVFRFDGAYPFQLADAFEGGILPRHVYGQVPFADWSTHDWSAEASVGAGSFLLHEHRPLESFVLRRNPLALAADAPRLDEVVARVVPDATALVTQLRTGALDYAERIPPREAAALDDADGISVVAYDAHDVTSIGWNHARPPLDDPSVRHALTFAIDREALVEELLYGFGRVAALPVAAAFGAEAIAPHPHEPDRARQRLADRGFAVRREDGSTTAGRTLELELLTNAGNPVREAALVKIQDDLARIGVAATVGTLEMRTLGGRIVAGEFDAYLLGTVAEARDLPGMVGTRNLPPAGGNYVRWSSPEVDALLTRLDGAVSLEEVSEIYAELAVRILAEQPMTHLFAAQRLAAHGERVRGVSIGAPTDPWGTMHRWWVATP